MKMLCHEGKISLWCFLSSACFICLLFLPNVTYDMVPKLWGAQFWGPLLYFIFINIVLRFIFKSAIYQVAIRASFLGFIFALGVYVWFLGSNNVCVFGLYMCVMSIFHYTEYLAIAIANPSSLSTDSFVINHSPQYTIAAISSWIEFFVETYFFPTLKTYHSFSVMGLILCVAGDLTRKTAMLTARSNFHHLVQNVKVEGHVLVTHGIYSICRHPSYAGWFYWAIATQIILINPVCLVGYTFASWLFFRERVTIEEITLLNFFGQQYCDYQQQVPTGIPFIYGYKIAP